MDRLRAMRLFVAVNEAGSLSAAARAIGEPLTTISRTLAQLEAEVGCTLLNRSTRRMALSEEGSHYLETCRRVIELVDGTERRIAGQSAEISGEISVTAPVLFGRLHLLPVVAEFLSRYPRINLRLLLVDRVVDLLDEGVDVAVRIGDLADSALLARRVASLRMLTCAAPDYIALNGVPETPATLSAHPCVTFSGLPGGARWVFRSREHGTQRVNVRSRLAANTVDAVVAAGVAGVGIARLLSYQAQSELRDGRLVEVLEAYEDTQIPVHLVYRGIRPDNTRLRTFIDFAAKRLREVFS